MARPCDLAWAMACETPHRWYCSHYRPPNRDCGVALYVWLRFGERIDAMQQSSSRRRSGAVTLFLVAVVEAVVFGVVARPRGPLSAGLEIAAAIVTLLLAAGLFILGMR